MIISKTPLRVSFCGGGTDLPAFYEKQPGAVLSTTIDKYVYVMVNRKFDSKIRASYSVTETVDTVDELQHDLIREALRMVGIDGGIEITSVSDIPSSGTGLGSSSTYTVGLLNALHAYVGHRASPGQLAEEACRIEMDVLGKPIGKQDQYAAAYGGLRYMQFMPDGSVDVERIDKWLYGGKYIIEPWMMMLYTGVTRSADRILEEQSTLTALPAVRSTLQMMKNQAGQARDYADASNPVEFGRLLHSGWLLKRTLTDSISTPQIDAWYDAALKHGALGGKILGAGGGGFLLLCAHPDDHARICEALPGMIKMPFQFENKGSRIIVED